MKTLTINYLSHDRHDCLEYWEITSSIINQIKQKEYIKLNILCTNNFEYEKYISDEIEVNKYVCKSYMDKIKIISESNTEYSMKLDEDIFFSSHIFDEFISMSQESNFNGIYWPLISLNTRFVDIFIEDFIKDKKVKNKINQEFSKVVFKKNLWGQGYKYIFLNKYTFLSSKWNPEKFINSVSKINTHYKGIHPVRLSFASQKLINKYILSNLNLIFKKNKYEIKKIQNFYVTSSCYFMKTIHFKNYLAQKSYDAYDEVQLNNYIKEFKIDSYLIKNGFAIHTIFSTVKGSKKGIGIDLMESIKYETNFVRQIKNYLNI
jgi:hypothetical protein